MAHDKIPITSITITRAEGPHALCTERSFASYAEANRWLFSNAETFPKGGGYDKHDFTVRFRDGAFYEGRLDCKHFDDPDPDLWVGEHIRAFSECYSGRHKPAHLSEESWARFVSRLDPATVAFHAGILDNYALDDAPVAVEA